VPFRPFGLRANPPTAQKHLRDLKSRISSQSKKNFVLEKDVRYLDSRIALLIQNRMALEEVSVLFLEIRKAH
jgi:Ras GTPase-activating-like protein IQGAP2/3